MTIFGGFAPNSKTAEELSKALGSRTVMSGSVSKGKDNPSQSLQMMERPLMTPEELKSLPKGNFVVMKTGCHPVKTKLKLFLDWGITFDKSFVRKEREDKEVFYANRVLLAENILKKYPKQVANTPTENDRKTMKSNSMKRDKPKEKFKV